MQIEKLVNVAIDFRLAELKARELGIIDISAIGTEREAFHYFGEKDFKKMIEGKKYTVEKFDIKQYKYTCVISGLTFFCITDDLLFEGDEKKIEEES